MESVTDGGDRPVFILEAMIKRGTPFGKSCARNFLKKCTLFNIIFLLLNNFFITIYIYLFIVIVLMHICMYICFYLLPIHSS